MTRQPLRSPEIKGVDGEHYDLNKICAVPGCPYGSEDPHHLFRRSALGGPFWWVQLEEGMVTGNVVGLCRKHHDQITVDAAWITWQEDQYLWENLFSTGIPLSFQPPHRPVVEGWTNEDGSQALTEAPTPSENGVCPSCLRPLHKHAKREPARIRRTWSITVPKDERENGAEMIDGLLEAARGELAKRGLPYGDAEAAKYFVLSTVLALFVQHAEEVLA